MKIRTLIACSSGILMLLLNGCSNTHTSASGILEHEILTRTSGMQEPIGELRTSEGFYGIALAIPATVEQQMRLKQSWRESCPVPLSDLSYLVLTYRGFDGQPKTGELVVHRRLALAVIDAFADLFAGGYPIERMELIENYDASDDRSMEANNTSGFNCRDITGKPGQYSKHSYGGALDINPLINPYVSPKSDVLTAMSWDGVEDKGVFLSRNGYNTPSPAFSFCTARPIDCQVLPLAGAAYVDRSLAVAGYLLPDSPAVKAFTGRGFDWGGTWGRLLDYQHFEYDTAKLLEK